MILTWKLLYNVAMIQNIMSKIVEKQNHTTNLKKISTVDSTTKVGNKMWCQCGKYFAEIREIKYFCCKSLGILGQQRLEFNCSVLFSNWKVDHVNVGTYGILLFFRMMRNFSYNLQISCFVLAFVIWFCYCEIILIDFVSQFSCATNFLNMKVFKNMLHLPNYTIVCRRVVSKSK